VRFTGNCRIMRILQGVVEVRVFYAAYDDNDGIVAYLL